MELKATLYKPYTDEERAGFVIEQNYTNGYDLVETETALEAWGRTVQEELDYVKQLKYQEALSGAKDYIENEAVYQFDENNSIEATDGNIGKLNAFLTGFQAGVYEEVSWVSKEDNVLTLNQEDVTNILLGIGAVQTEVWSVQFIGYKNAINNAQTVSEVNSIVIDYEVNNGI